MARAIFDPAGGVENRFSTGRPIVDLELAIDVGGGTMVSGVFPTRARGC